jgi:hypothetical protein
MGNKTSTAKVKNHFGRHVWRWQSYEKRYFEWLGEIIKKSKMKKKK